MPGLGQAFTARWSSAAAFFLFALFPPFFMSFLWRDHEAGGLFAWREPNIGHWIMLPLLFLAWVINVIDAWRGSPGLRAPCIDACPAHIHIPQYINLILEGRLEESHDLICRWTPLVGIIGHVCHHPCEGRCTRHDFDESVAICPLKAYVGQHMIANNLLSARPAPPGEKAPRVAVIGSGPAGLSAAFFLARLGMRPTILEALPVAGGMLAVGIPSYRLPRHILRAEIDFVRNQGVDLRTGTAVGRDVRIPDLFADGYRAVLAAPGTHRESKLRLAGEEKEGVVPGLSFLRSVNLGQRGELDGDVVVVGGGNVAMDAARCALRLGARRVTVVYRRSRLEMPANTWEVAEAEEEGINFLFLTNPVRVLGGDTVEGVECLEMRLGEPDESGRRRPVPVEGSEFTIPCRWLLPAIGMSPDTSFLEGSGALLDPGGQVRTGRRSLMTGARGVFAAGDAVLGPSSVIEASFHGREAAIQVAGFLRSGVRYVFPRVRIGRIQCDFASRPRVPQVTRVPEDRRGDFGLIHQVYAQDPCLSEGRRCLRCDLNM